jgi:small-conductance mechanosensitive channel
MAQAPPPNVLTGSLSFFDRLGVFDVLLPFILVFTIVYAILEKTKIYGLEKISKGEKTLEVTRKNLNAMTAFVVAFFVVASSQLVAIINETLAHTVLILILILCFMLLVGAFHTGDKEFSLDKYPGWKKIFMIIIFVAIVLIFMNAAGWLPWLYSYVLANWNSTVVASIGLIVVLVAFMAFVTSDRKVAEEKKEGG